jgi:hypothetical protein
VLTIFLLAGAYLLLPGHPDSFFKGIPLGLGPFVVLTVGVFAWMFFRGVPDRDRGWTRWSVALACLCAIKLAAALSAPPVGWIGRYYPNERFEGPYRRSTDFPHLDATRIDRAIEFRDDELPVYFFNEADFNRDIRREVTMPVTVAWTGYVQASRETTLPLVVSTRGRTTVSIDGHPAIDVASRDVPASRSEMLTFSPGEHRIDVTYLKPANTDPLIAVHGFDERRLDAPLLITHAAAGSVRRLAFRAAALVGRAADLLAGVAFVLILGRLGAARREGSPNWWRVPSTEALCAAMFALFLVQGIQAAAPHVHRAVSLSGGDDWLAFEARAREVLTGGLLMPFGWAPGKGEVFYYYPGYSYFLAAVHRLTGEDLSGPIAVNFLLLFLANVVSYRIAKATVGRSAAVAGTIALVAIEELAFVRHYTVVLLSENLYFLTVPLTVLGLVRFVQHGRRTSLAWAGLAAGASALTRPVMLLYLVPAVCIVLVASMRARQKPTTILASVGVLTACWFLVVSLATIRNYLVAGSPVLICETPAHMFVQYNVPPTVDPRPYMTAYGGGIGSAARILARIVVEHPLAWLDVALRKIAFSFGVLPILGGRLHPELVLASGGYLAALVWSSRARALDMWPIHGFIAAHLAGMVLSNPNIYGYRLILPIYLFLPMFGAHLVVDAIARVRPATRSDVAAAGAIRSTR